jgi:ketosteroid isomerase-like protein
MDELEESFEQVFAAYKSAVFARDADALLALYDQNVRVFDMWGEWSYDGVEAWRRMVSEWFGSLGTERVVVEVEDVHTILAHDVVVAHAVVTYKGVSAEGAELRAIQNRLTWALQRKDRIKNGEPLPMLRVRLAGLP